MTNLEAKLKFRERTTFHKFTEEHPDSRITYWCNELNCIMVIESKDMEDIEDFQKVMGCCCPNSKISRQGAHLEVMLQITNHKGTSTNELITKSGCWYMQPVIIEKGWEFFTVNAVDRSHLEALIKSVRELKIEVVLTSLHDLPLSNMCNKGMLPVAALGRDITDKQLDLIRLAYEEGYFDQPARITADRLAEKVGISRSTLAEHLRKAEYKLLRNALPALLVNKSAQ
ncbi:MAG TPA: helix-turn-helix domain-containing protein [Methanomassiliicoccales archaeon]|nr:helix-turn-helix domain-containing protein [Methanomassiliicoccales archaeon]